MHTHTHTHTNTDAKNKHAHDRQSMSCGILRANTILNMYHNTTEYTSNRACKQECKNGWQQIYVKHSLWDRKQPAPPHCHWRHLRLHHGWASAGLHNKHTSNRLVISLAPIPIYKRGGRNQALTLIVDGLWHHVSVNAEVQPLQGRLQLHKHTLKHPVIGSQRSQQGRQHWSYERSESYC